MIPVISIIKLVATLIAFFVTYLGYKKWKETQLLSFNYFWKVNLFHGLECAAFLSFGFIGLVLGNLYTIQVMWNLAALSGGLLVAFLIPLLLAFLGAEEKYQKLSQRVLLVLALGSFLVPWFFFDKAKVVTYPITGELTGITWLTSVPLFLLVFAALFCITFMIIPSFVLLIRSFRVDDVVQKNKGILLSLGVFWIGISGLWFWFVIPIVKTSFMNDVLGGLFCCFGQILFALGMLVEDKRIL